jgi:DNA-binding XRE family transcriptional regulator
MSKRTSKGADTRLRYCAICGGVHVQLPSGSPNRPQGHGRFAFLPGARVSLKGLKPKGFRGVPQTVRDHLKARRLDLGMFQKDVAEQLGIDHFTLINWEKNRTEPAVTCYPAILAFLGYDPTPKPETIGEHIKARRRALGWTIAKAAEELGVDPTAIFHWEHGGTILRREHRKLVAAFLGIDHDTLSAQMSRAWNAAHGMGNAGG